MASLVEQCLAVILSMTLISVPFIFGLLDMRRSAYKKRMRIESLKDFTERTDCMRSRIMNDETISFDEIMAEFISQSECNYAEWETGYVHRVLNEIDRLNEKMKRNRKMYHAYSY